ncbi:glycosyltransferase family 4 protein [Bacteroides sp. GD17]|jgi:glycosyltransferase involved in cell wall biosynthesis|uniref:glycosyltransferase family 4 protein n=1 Tax=Bacteroides sp. GD17 TaxID=3139826 RepID=UPI0025F46E4F|nr:glycosyltransferase family 4 protein [uncultured Bacteroides sp.]
MKITYLGYAFGKSVRRHQEGNYPSHFLYGFVELAKKGENVNYELIPSGMIAALTFTIRLIKDKSDIIIIPYVYEGPLSLLTFLKKFKLIKASIIAISHKSLKRERSYAKRILYKWLYQSFDKILFHSPLNMQESQKLHWVDSSKMEIIHWGVDIDFYKKIYSKEAVGFVSTGRENRDFNTLIAAFSKTNYPLKIYTNKVNYENDYTFLKQYIDKYPNIHICLVENTKEAALTAMKMVASSFCVAIPVYSNSIYYCVGHTSIVEALALGKPIIATRNPYHPIDIEKEEIGILVEAEDIFAWIDAITYLIQHEDEAMQMGKRAQKLAEEVYNINHFSEELYGICCSLARMSALGKH